MAFNKNYFNNFLFLFIIILCSLFSKQLISILFLLISILIYLLINDVDYKKFFKKFYLIILVSFFFFLFQKNINPNLEFYIVPLKFFIFALTAKTLNASIPTNILLSILKKIFYMIPIKKENKSYIFQLFILSYTILENILFDEKLKFKFSKNFYKSFINYIEKIQNEIIFQIKNNKIQNYNYNIKKTGFSYIIFFILYIGSWCYIEYFV